MRKMIVAMSLALLSPMPAHGQDPDSQLIAAAWNGLTEEIEFLLDVGAEVNAKNKDGMTALIVGAWNGHTETVKVLLSKYASVDERNTRAIQHRDGRTRRSTQTGHQFCRSTETYAPSS